MNIKRFTTLAALTFFASASVFAAASKRYIVVYKSDVGMQAMDNYMKKESSKALGKTKSLKNVKMMLLTPSNSKVVESFKNHPEVADVVEEFMLPAPKPMSASSLNISKAQSAVNTTVVAADPMTFQPGTKTPWGILAVNAPSAWTASGAGSEAHVLVIDTGIDVNHESLAGRFVKTKNFVPEIIFGMPIGDVDENAFQDDVGHGTHVSGTVGSSYNEKTGFVGVAPKAKLSMGKVCIPEGCPSGSIIEAINWGAQEKFDIITMSLGGPMPECTGTLEECIDYYLQKGMEYGEAEANAQADVNYYKTIKLEEAALASAEAAGVMTIAASGNSGTPDGGSPEIGYPARYDKTLSVGAVDSTIQRALFSQYGPQLDIVAPGVDVVSSIPTGSGKESVVKITIGGVETEVKSSSFNGVKVVMGTKSADLMDAGLGKPSDFTGKNFVGKFALIGRGEITFGEKVKNAMAAKAAGVLIYNNAAGVPSGTVGDGKEIDYPVAMIEQTVGQNIVTQLTAGQAASASVATVTTSYSAFQGTSMATPHVAGVAALVVSTYKLSHQGQAPTPAFVREVLMKTARPLLPNDNNQYGSGFVQADAAVAAAQ